MQGVRQTLTPTHRRAPPLVATEKLYVPALGGVIIPSQRADNVPGPLVDGSGQSLAAIMLIISSTRLVAGCPPRAEFVKYSPFTPSVLLWLILLPNTSAGNVYNTMPRQTRIEFVLVAMLNFGVSRSNF